MSLLHFLTERLLPRRPPERAEHDALRKELERQRARTVQSKRNLDQALADANHANAELAEMLAIEDKLLAMGLPSRRGARSTGSGGGQGGSGGRNGK